MPVNNALIHALKATAEGYAVAGGKALPVILSMPTRRHCPFLIFRLKRWTSLSTAQPL